MNSQQLSFRIGHIGIRVKCEDVACLEATHALCALYEPSEFAKPTLDFRIFSDAGKLVLICNSDSIWKSDDAGEIAAAFELSLYRKVADSWGAQILSLHAAAVAACDRVILFSGASDSGKSSMATKMLLEGFDYLSDEFALLDNSGRVHPFPRPLQWGKQRHPAFTHKQMLASNLFKKTSYSFPDHSGKILTSLLWLPERVVRKPLPTHALILPRFIGRGEKTLLEPIRRSQALMELAPEVHQQFPATESIRLLHEYLPDDLPIFRLRYGDIDSAWRILKQENLIPGR